MNWASRRRPSRLKAAAQVVLYTVGFFLAGAALLLPHYHRGRPAVVMVQDEPPPGLPPGWTEACASRLIAPVCRTYPPGDRRWEPKAPLPPRRPLPR